MNKNLQNFVSMLIQSNPNVANNPQAKDWLNVIQSGDSKRGQQIAENICRNMGVSKKEAYESASQWARQFFGNGNGR